MEPVLLISPRDIVTSLNGKLDAVLILKNTIT